MEPTAAGLEVTVAGASDIGQIREHNEDHFLIGDLDTAQRIDGRGLPAGGSAAEWQRGFIEVGEPWGRLIQIVPSGGYRDVRHLAGDEVVLGREEGDIVFRDDAFLSRRHAALTWDGKRALITDLGSSNGTFIRLTGPTVLRHGDHVRMGDQLLRIELGR